MLNPKEEEELSISIATYISKEFDAIMEKCKNTFSFEEPERFKERVMSIAKDIKKG